MDLASRELKRRTSDSRSEYSELLSVEACRPPNPHTLLFFNEESWLWLRKRSSIRECPPRAEEAKSKLFLLDERDDRIALASILRVGRGRTGRRALLAPRRKRLGEWAETVFRKDVFWKDWSFQKTVSKYDRRSRKVRVVKGNL